MNTLVDLGVNSRQPNPTRTISVLPLLLCALVTAIALLSFYVQVLNEHVQRGELLRQAQRAAPASHGSPGWEYAPAMDPAGQGFVHTAAAR